LTSSRTYLRKISSFSAAGNTHLLTPGSYASELCRCIWYRDFTTNSTYIKAFGELIEDIHADRGVPLKEAFRETYVTAPPLPMNYVARPEALTALRDALIADGCARHIALTALKVSAPI
jgi:hypothetical protein